MTLSRSSKLKAISSKLRQGGIVVIPTDTLYGIVTPALNKRSVERLYKVRRRNPAKPFIILISSLADLKKFNIRRDRSTVQLLKSFWPGKVSVILPCETMKLRYLHRGTQTLAFRFPKPRWLRKLVALTGPLVAPSANPEGHKPALTIAQAKKYFRDEVDFYVDGGKKVSKPSTLIAIKNGKPIVLRAGAKKI